MNNNKLISILQSRIAKRKHEITGWWQRYSSYKSYTSQSARTGAERVSIIATELGVLQKQDKQIMKALIEAQSKHAHHVDTCWRLTHEVLKLREQLKHYKLTGHPIVKGNAN